MTTRLSGILWPGVNLQRLVAERFLHKLVIYFSVIMERGHQSYHSTQLVAARIARDILGVAAIIANKLAVLIDEAGTMRLAFVGHFRLAAHYNLDLVAGHSGNPLL